MGKKRSVKPKGKPSGPEGWQQKPLIATFRGAPEFKAWLQELAAHDRQTVAGVTERALVHYARSVGFDKQAPAR